MACLEKIRKDWSGAMSSLLIEQVEVKRVELIDYHF